MANPQTRLSDNVAGEFFVDASCIDCDTCRQLAGHTFAEGPDHAFVHRQPSTDAERRDALRALVSCPTGSIGTTGRNEAKEVMGEFPLRIEDGVYYCGFTSPKSFGGSSYFIAHPDGNWLVDSPKYLPQLVRQFEALGGITRIFLTHRDDVADAVHYYRRFGAERIIHEAELASQPDAEIVLKGTEPIELAPGFVAVPTPGHTRGHMVLNYRERMLFTGDHLWWDRGDNRLGASRDYCWYSWSEQTKSMARLAEQEFEWVLPGHGQRVWLPADEMRRQVIELVDRMKDEAAKPKRSTDAKL